MLDVLSFGTMLLLTSGYYGLLSSTIPQIFPQIFPDVPIFPDFSRVFQLFSRFFQVFQLLSTKNPRPVDMPKHSAFLPATPGPLPPGPPGNLPPRHRPASQRGDLSDREREVMGNKMWDENKQN